MCNYGEICMELDIDNMAHIDSRINMILTPAFWIPMWHVDVYSGVIPQNWINAMCFLLKYLNCQLIEILIE